MARIKLKLDYLTGWADLEYGFDRAINAQIGQFPGVYFDGSRKRWRAPLNVLPWLKEALPQHQWREEVVRGPAVPPELPHFAERHRPYQREGSDFQLRFPAGSLLKFDPRTGKAPTTIGTVCRAATGGLIDCAFVGYPVQARRGGGGVGGWVGDLWKWAGVVLQDPSEVPAGKRKRAKDSGGAPARGQCEWCEKKRDLFAAFEGPDIYVSVCDACLTKEERRQWARDLNKQPFFALGCHYEAITDYGEAIFAALRGRRYMLVWDEIQEVNNLRAGRGKLLVKLATGCFDVEDPLDLKPEECAARQVAYPVVRTGLSGTVMMNRPANLWGVFHLLQPGSAGFWGQFRKRYCGGKLEEHGYHMEKGADGQMVQAPGHWDAKGSSNEQELASRLAAISMTKKRYDPDVAPYLPKADRFVTVCDVREADLTAYRAMERVLAPKMAKLLEAGVEGDAPGGDLEALSRATSKAKIPTAVQRVRHHLGLGRMLVVFAYGHDVLQALTTGLGAGLQLVPPDPEGPPGLTEAHDPKTGEIFAWFVAGGWLPPAKRDDIMAAWREFKGPAALLVNVMSASKGIDFSQAAGSLHLEFAWRPADVTQAEDRLQKVHGWGQDEQPESKFHEYLAARGTVDEDMIGACVRKIAIIQEIAGHDRNMAEFSGTMRKAGVVASRHLVLESKDADVISDAIQSMIARMGQEREEATSLDFSGFEGDSDEDGA